MRKIKTFEAFNRNYHGPVWIEGMDICDKLEYYINSPLVYKFIEISDKKLKDRIEKFFQEHNLGDPNSYEVWEVYKSIMNTCDILIGKYSSDFWNI